MKKLILPVTAALLLSPLSWGAKKKKPEVYPSLEETTVTVEVPKKKADTVVDFIGEESEEELTPVAAQTKPPETPTEVDDTLTMEKTMSEEDLAKRVEDLEIVLEQMKSGTRSETQNSSSEARWEPVPKDQVKAMGERLKLIYSLMKHHGRAYDYRSHTVSELRKTLEQLNQKK